MNCSFDDEPVLQCTKQAKMYSKGYVMTYDYEFKLKHLVKDDDIQSDYVDWGLVHNSKECTEVKEFWENKK